MDVYPKFIIEDGALILGKVKYHKELALDKEKVKGGGWWIREEDTFIFHGDSTDFGRASVDDIKKAIEDNRVFTNPYSDDSIANEFSFEYRDECGETTKLK